MAHYGYLPNVQRLQLKACGVQSVVDLDKAAERAEAMGVDIYIPGLPASAGGGEDTIDAGGDTIEGGEGT